MMYWVHFDASDESAVAVNTQKQYQTALLFALCAVVDSEELRKFGGEIEKRFILNSIQMKCSKGGNKTCGTAH